MKTNAIIAEYNPFHKGHFYQMEQAKIGTGADATIVILSGNYVQRGIPAVMDKQTRTRLALEAGADLVIELPLFYSCSSAEYFASGAVSILDRLGVVSTLCFGSECGDIQAMARIADILLEESVTFQNTLRYELESGKSYPYARNQAILAVEPSLIAKRDLFQSPNNILGIEYLKALKKLGSTITPYTTQRSGNGYLNASLNGSYCSALALREAFHAGTPISELTEHLAQCNHPTYEAYYQTYKPVSADDFSDLLYMKLQENASTGYDYFFDVSGDLSNRIQKELGAYTGFQQFANILKTKDMTYTRISRALMHILLHITKADLQLYHPDYVRVLGFGENGKELLKDISQKNQICLLTKLADAKKTLSESDFHYFEKQMAADYLYEYVKSKKAGVSPVSEYSKPICILS